MITPRYATSVTSASRFDMFKGGLGAVNDDTATNDQANDGEVQDNYLAKLVKYVPAPVIGIFVPFWQATESDTQRWFVFLTIGLVGTIFWLFLAHTVDKSQTGNGSPAWFFVLGALSFVCWSLAVTDVGPALSPSLGIAIDGTWSWIIFLTGAFFIPGIDEAVTSMIASRQKNAPADPEKPADYPE